MARLLRSAPSTALSAMRPTFRRTAAFFAAAYLLSGWLASALHHHAHHHGGHAAAAAGAPAKRSCCGHAHHKCGGPTHGTDERHGDGGSHDESGCVVCDFLAKPPLPVARVEIVKAAEPLIVAAAPRRPVAEPVSPDAPRSRGPPAV